ncbi:MAG: sugar ABC transporter substrate-binding protein [Ignavibacteriaceae bacterium]|nr:sugar ABC transporter substrate-binding protein [Ignavibacteriaceae bacterium]
MTQNKFNFYTTRLLPGLFLIAALLTIGISLSGCRKARPANEVEFWTLQLSPVFDEYINGVIRDFEKENPGIKIKWVDIPYDAAIQKLMASLSAGAPPDVINLSADFLSKFDKMDVFYDISGLYSTDTLKSIYLNNALDDCIYKDRVIALPWYLSTYALIYNKKLMTAAGLQDNIPATYDEFIAAIKLYKQTTGKFAAFWNIGKDSYLPMMLESEGIRMIDERLEKALFNSPEGIKAIDNWVQLYKEGYLPGESIVKTGASIIEPYQSGHAAMVFTGPVFLKRIKDNAPSVYRNTEIAPPLAGKTGRHELAVMSVSVLNRSLNKKAATDFSLFLTNAENQLNFCKLATIYPSVKAALDDDYFTNPSEDPMDKARVMGAQVIHDAARLRTYLRHPKFDRLRDIFDEAIQSACLGTKSTKEALDDAAREWNILLNQKRH